MVPSEAVSLDSILKTTGVAIGRFADHVSEIRGLCVEASRMVSIVAVGSSPVNVVGKAVRLSYLGRIIDVVNRMEEKERNELILILKAFTDQRRGFVKVYGLWMNPREEKGDSMLYLICEWLDSDISCLLIECDEDQSGSDRNLLVPGMIGMELCEAMMSLHSRGFVCGCFSLSCFRFDVYGHIYLDLNYMLMSGRQFREKIGTVRWTDKNDFMESLVLASPEMFTLLCDKNGFIKPDSNVMLGHASDVWSLACLLVIILIGNTSHSTKILKCLYDADFSHLSQDKHKVWLDKVVVALEESLLGKQFLTLKQVIHSCLSYDPGNRPLASDVWKCIRESLIKTKTDHVRGMDIPVVKENFYCLLAFNPKSLRKQTHSIAKNQGIDHEVDPLNISSADADQINGEEACRDIVSELCKGSFRSETLDGHRHSVRKLAIGGRYLFSSSDDKTIRVWSLQDFSHLQTFIGHEHIIMALVVFESNELLCISGDVGGFIFVWSIMASTDQGPLKKWREHNDWRYTGVHSLAILGSQYICSGSGDKTIKLWSLQDYSLVCAVEAHKSTVSSLVVDNGIVYSGSWDGTIRLWRLDDDHFTLAELQNVSSGGGGFSVLSVSVNGDLIAATYDNGYVQLWRNEVQMKLVQIENGPIFASHIDKRWLLTGGWDKSIKIQELSENEFQVDAEMVGSIDCDSVITSLLLWEGKIFVGLSNNSIKVYYQQS